MRYEERFQEIYNRDPESLACDPCRICPIGAHVASYHIVPRHCGGHHAVFRAAHPRLLHRNAYLLCILNQAALAPPATAFAVSWRFLMADAA